jgi:hypothetical protein
LISRYGIEYSEMECFMRENNFVRRTSLYAKDRDQKIRLACNEFAYKKAKDTHKLGDRFLQKGQFSIAYMRNCR